MIFKQTRIKSWWAQLAIGASLFSPELIFASSSPLSVPNQLLDSDTLVAQNIGVAFEGFNKALSYTAKNLERQGYPSIVESMNNLNSDRGLSLKEATDKLCQCISSFKEMCSQDSDERAASVFIQKIFIAFENAKQR